ncbi:polyprenyl synthetase family protein [Nocardia sp. BMG51109]|uniref:polyprenyl synthetase family protein n=1 Tax=Nocardia sp. BMG51109 TaxID=1056816 RepID=UPI000463B12C|nr:polyprenyl synthetase family protein [Nocardia sp. BMG51109]
MMSMDPAITRDSGDFGQCESAERSRSVSQILDEARQLTEPSYRAAIERLPGPLDAVAKYHIGWADSDGNPARATGKAIRPALTLLSARAAGGRPVRAVPAAVAVELIHDFSLLHDDVMDGDRTRRHRPAAWTVFGTGTAVLTGDGLLALASDLVASVPVPTAPVVLARTLMDLCRGQAADTSFEQRSDVTLADAIATAENKTGGLLGAACQLGALTAGADPGAGLCYWEFGRQLGMVFQLVDDLLGIWGDSRRTGKPAGADLARKKQTLPVVAALASDSAAGKRLAQLYRSARVPDQRAVGEAAMLIEQAGGRDWVRTEIPRRWKRAFDSLAEADPVDDDAVTELRALARYLAHRSS